MQLLCSYFDVLVVVVAAIVAVCLCVDGLAAEPQDEPSRRSADELRFSIGPNLFVDDYLIERSFGLKRTTHQPQKLQQPVLGKEEAWHQQPQWFFDAKRDPKTGRFRAWYIVKNPGGEPDLAYAYAESTDGINWIRPDLGIVEVQRSAKNNLIEVPHGHYGFFLVDDGPACADPSRRYKMAYFGLAYLKPGLYLAFSEDGFRFTEHPGNPILPMDEPSPVFDMIGGVIADIIDGCWDPIRKEYLIGCKIVRNGYPGKPHYNEPGYRRLVGSTTSRDFLHWAKPGVIVTPDPANGIEEFYGMKPTVRGNLYLGFLRVLRDDLPADDGGEVLGIGWTELVTSRDGRNWTRHQDKFIDRNLKPGTWDHAMAWIADCVTVGDKEYVYYGGYSQGHKVGDREVGLALLRKDGFVSRDAGSAVGTLKTPLSQLPGDRITLNATVRGELKVRVVNDKGKAIPGYGWLDCVPIRGDSVAHPVRWKGGSALPRFERVSLEFSLSDAELYGFDLVR